MKRKAQKVIKLHKLQGIGIDFPNCTENDEPLHTEL